jgi:hypothetical protein
MINNQFPGKQTFLTAAHCNPGANDILMFNYQSPICAVQNPGLSTQTIQGLTTLARSTTYDFHLMQVVEAIPATYNVYAMTLDLHPRVRQSTTTLLTSTILPLT